MTYITSLARESIQKLVPYSSARNESSVKGIQLDANENPFWRNDQLNRYPDPQPILLRERLAALYGVAATQLLMTRGSDEGIDLLMRVFCEANKDTIVITPPTYGMYEIAASIQGVRVIRVPLNKEFNFSLDKDKIIKQGDESVKLIFLCSPNNPTGNCLDRADVISICREFENKALIIVDEAYIEFSTTSSFCQLVAQYPNLVVLRTFSKAYGLAGARFGALIANCAVIDLLKKVMAPYPIPTPIERLVNGALSKKNQAKIASQIEKIQKEREELRNFLLTISSVNYVYSSEANFLLVDVTNPLIWMDTCKTHEIIIRSRINLPNLQNCVRITIGTEQENNRLREVLSYV